MLPIMCIQLPCMNIDVTMVIQCRPSIISAGTTDHCFTNSSPPPSSSTKKTAFNRMMAVVTKGKFNGRRDASDRGIIQLPSSLAIFSSLPSVCEQRQSGRPWIANSERLHRDGGIAEASECSSLPVLDGDERGEAWATEEAGLWSGSAR